VKVVSSDPGSLMAGKPYLRTRDLMARFGLLSLQGYASHHGTEDVSEVYRNSAEKEWLLVAPVR
jgi:hypothetical protein